MLIQIFDTTNPSLGYNLAFGGDNRAMSEAQREAIRKGSRKKAVICIETQKEYESAAEAERETGIAYQSIGKVCNGQRKTAGKLHWRWKEC